MAAFSGRPSRLASRAPQDEVVTDGDRQVIADNSLAGGRLTIDLAALARNWCSLAAMAPGAETGAVVKGDGYGIGLPAAVAALSWAGCRTFFVALADEGRTARAIAPDATIYVLDGLPPGGAAALAADRLRPILSSLPEVSEWAAWKNAGGAGEAALHVDTGMNRLGLSPGEARRLAGEPATVAGLGLMLLMSHLACADQPGHPMTERQRAAFAALAPLFPGLPLSLANSAGVLRGPAFHFALTRPGIALYGARAAEDYPPLETVVTAEGRVLLVREAETGETVGYGATETLCRRSKIAVLGIGYADGYHRLAGSGDTRKGASVFIHGRRAPVVGRVSMDLMSVDVTDVPGVERGDYAELFGPNIPVDEVAHHAETIGYELLTSLGRRYERRYLP
ncbi:MAG: alanine racemase [Bauldia sp.]|nr:alanine racemase [Bauldia sp.]